MKDITLNQDDFGTIAICAIRYCQGRQTYMPDLVRGIVRPHLKELDDVGIGVLHEDCEYQKRMELYGDPYIDMPGWLQWEKEVREELERRSKV